MVNNFYFFTATILEWKHLKPNKYKDIIIESLKFLVVRIFAFVIIPNHIHLVWKIDERLNKSDFQRNFLKFTAQLILKDLKKNHQKILENFFVGTSDRKYQIWERNPLSIILISNKIVEQKINYIHKNPVLQKWNLASEPHDYKYSSAKFYYERINEFGFLENYMNF